MDTSFIFIDRRKGRDRREDLDPCKDIPMDLYHRKRRKSKERRDISRTLTDDYYAYMQKIMEQIQSRAENRDRSLDKPRTTE